MTKPKKPLAGYRRVSRKGARDDDKLRSPEYQHDLIARYAKAEGVSVEWFDTEIDGSGSTPQRAILDQIIEKVEAGEFGGIIVAKLDRLSRLKPKDRVLLFERIEDAGGIVLSASEQLDPSTPEGRFARDVFLGVARMQWEKYRENFEIAKEGAIKNGIPVHSRPPVGYRAHSDRTLEPDRKTAAIVREVFERRAQGEGPSALAAFLEKRRVKTSQGSKVWTKQAIYGLIRNRVYLGELSYGRDRRFVNAAAHEPIVDLATWQAAQKPGTQKLADLRAKRVNILTGIARCRGCGYCLQATTTSRGKLIYRCTRVHAGGVCPEPVRIEAEALEAAAVDAFWILQRELEAEGKSRREHDKIPVLAAALERAERRLKQFLSPAVQDEVGDTPEWATGLRDRRLARDRAAEALGKARAEADSQSEKVPSTASLRKAWKTMERRDQRELLGLRFDLIAVGRDGRIVVFPRGTGPSDLPARGFRKDPRLFPITDVPRKARTLAA